MKMEKQRIIEVTNEVAKHYNFMKQEDVDAVTCGYCTECPEWHVYGYKNFSNICKTLEMEPQRRGNHDFVMFNGVKIFCLY
jgi:hypothetical protein